MAAFDELLRRLSDADAEFAGLALQLIGGAAGTLGDAGGAEQQVAGEGAAGAALNEDALDPALGTVSGELAGAEGRCGDALEQGEALDGGVGAQVGGEIEAAQAGAALGRGGDAEVGEGGAEARKRLIHPGGREQRRAVRAALGEDEALALGAGVLVAAPERAQLGLAGLGALGCGRGEVVRRAEGHTE